MKNSSRIFYESGIKFEETDKVSHHGYHRFYPYFLNDLRSDEVVMVEIGVGRQGSLQFWRDYFPKLTYYGIDIQSEIPEEEIYPGIKIIRGDQSDSSFLKELVGKVGEKANFIIDDGSHNPVHQITSFDYLFQNLLGPGGVYIIEDIETSYWKKASLYGYECNFGVGHPNSTVEVFKSIVDSVNLEFLNYEVYSSNERISHAAQRMIETISFAHNAIIIVKKDFSSFGDYYNRKYRFSGKV